jgi:hypothetical protein
MHEGDAVFAADGSHVGSVTVLDASSMTVGGEGHFWKIPRSAVAYESDERVFLSAPNRAAVDHWRSDVAAAGGLRGWWYRHILAPSPRPLGGHLGD